jgi:DNA-binding CsgD family transcriptional regulator
MAKIMLITERTVNFHIQKMNKSLGTCNKYISVAKAKECGILT